MHQKMENEVRKPMSKAEKLAEAKQNINQAARRMASRVKGMIEREADRLMDQYPILDKRMSRSQIEKTVWRVFREALDTDEPKKKS